MMGFLRANAVMKYIQYKVFFIYLEIIRSL